MDAPNQKIPSFICMSPLRSQPGQHMDDIIQSIFLACDTQCTGSVEVSQLIQYIQPYLTEDLSALDDLRNSLMSESDNVSVTYGCFLKVMRCWCEKMSSAASIGELDLNTTPSFAPLGLDDKQSPLTHSTPRASLGDKLLKYRDSLKLNLSNVSSYSLSSSQLDQSQPDKAVLEEELKKLECQLSKVTNELVSVKQQLVVSEDQNEQLQQDLERINRRLNSEQQVNEHLKKDVKQTEELQEEVYNYKKEIRELKHKLQQSKKEITYYSESMRESDSERTKLEKKIEVLSKQNQENLKQLLDLKNICYLKDEELRVLSEKYKELNTKLSQERDLNDQLLNQNELQTAALTGILKTKTCQPCRNVSSLKSSGTTPPSSTLFSTECPTSQKGLDAELSAKEEQEESSEDGDIDSEIQLKIGINLSRSIEENLSPLQDEIFKAAMKDLNVIMMEKADLEKQLDLLKEEKRQLEQTLAETTLQKNEHEVGCNKCGSLREQLEDTRKVLGMKNAEYELKLEECTQQEEEAKSLLQRFTAQSNNLIDAQKQITSMSVTIKDLRKQIEDLNSSKKELESELTALKSAKDAEFQKFLDLDNVAGEVRDQVERRNVFIEELKQLNEQLKLKLNKLEEDLSQKIGSILKLHDELAKYVGEKNELWRTIKSLQGDLHNKNVEFKNLTETHNQQKIEYSSLLTIHDVEMVKNVKLEQLLANSEQERTEASDTCTALKEKIALQEEVIMRLETNIKELKIAFKESTVVESQDSTCQTLDIEADFLKIKAESDQILEELEEKLNQEVNKNRELTQDLKDLNQKHAEITLELTEMKDKLTHNETQMREKVQESYEKCESIATKLKQTMEALNEKEIEVLGLQNKLLLAKDCELKLTEDVRKNEALMHNLSEITQDCTKTKEELIALQELLSKKDSKLLEANDRLVSEIEQKLIMSNELKHLIEKNSALLEDLDRVKEENNKLVQEVRNQKKENATLSAHLSVNKRAHLELQGELNLSIEQKNALSMKLKESERQQPEFNEQLNRLQTINMQLQEELRLLKESQRREEDKLRKNERESLKGSKKCLKAALGDAKKASFSKQEIIIDKLRSTIEDLEASLKKEREQVKRLTLQGRVEQETEEVGVQVDISTSSEKICECNKISKFTLASGTESPDSPSVDFESSFSSNRETREFGFRLNYRAGHETILEVPALNVGGFADEFIEELDTIDSGARAISGEQLSEKEQLEAKVTALTMWMLANSSNISQRIEAQTEAYRTRYEALLSLVSDISYRLRDHVCIGTPEPIVPVYVLLEEVKLQLSGLVQNAGQVGALVCEDKMKRCWSLLLNYVATLRKDNDDLRIKVSESAPKQTATTSGTGDSAIQNQRRRPLITCLKGGVCVFAVACLALLIGLAIKFSCRMISAEYEHCPFDWIIERVHIGRPRM